MNGILHIKSCGMVFQPLNKNERLIERPFVKNANMQKIIFLKSVEAVEQYDAHVLVHMNSANTFLIDYESESKAKEYFYDILKQHKKNDGFILETLEYKF